MDALDGLDDDLLMEAEQARAGAQGAKNKRPEKRWQERQKASEISGACGLPLHSSHRRGAWPAAGETIEKYQDGNPWDPDIELEDFAGVQE